MLTYGKTPSKRNQIIKSVQQYTGELTKLGLSSADIKFLEGREKSLKQRLGKEILNILEDSFKKSLKELNLQITVLVEDLPKDFYFKYPEGTFSK